MDFGGECSYSDLLKGLADQYSARWMSRTKLMLRAPPSRILAHDFLLWLTTLSNCYSLAIMSIDPIANKWWIWILSIRNAINLPRIQRPPRTINSSCRWYWSKGRCCTNSTGTQRSILKIWKTTNVLMTPRLWRACNCLPTRQNKSTKELRKKLKELFWRPSILRSSSAASSRTW